jgi:hypothetical protein
VIRNDAVLRGLVCSVGIVAAFLSALGWRNMQRNADRQIRLIGPGEMNTHLAEMNFAAAGLAHETRNPLNLIRGFAQMISQEVRHQPKLGDHAAAIIEEADRVTVQLNEFINHSKPREVHRAAVDLATMVADLVRTLQPDLEEKQIRVTWTPEPLRILVDAQLFRQALFNLLLERPRKPYPPKAPSKSVGASKMAVKLRWKLRTTDPACRPPNARTSSNRTSRCGRRSRPRTRHSWSRSCWPTVLTSSVGKTRPAAPASNLRPRGRP